MTLGDNQISKFDPQNLTGLKELAILDLGRNRIGSIPYGIPAILPVLARLDLRDNDLSRFVLEVSPFTNSYFSVPTDLGFMESLNVISLTGNPLKSIGQNILSVSSFSTCVLTLLFVDWHSSSQNTAT